MVVFLTLGLALILLAAMPGARRPLFLVAVLSLVSALVARSLNLDGFLVAGAGVVPLLVGLLTREIAATLDLVAEPRRELRRAKELARREEERRREGRERERERRRRQQQQRRAA